MINITPEICYLAGAFRDGSISTQWQVRIKQKNREWLTEVIIPIFNKEFALDLQENSVYIQKDKNVRFYIAFKNKNVWKQIKELFDIPEDTSFWGTPTFVKNLNNSLLRYYIRGFFDAEGGIPRKPLGSKLYISFTQRNYESLEFIRNKLKSEWNIISGRLRISDKKSHSWRFAITGKDSIKRFITEIGTKHPLKIDIFKIMSDLLGVR